MISLLALLPAAAAGIGLGPADLPRPACLAPRPATACRPGRGRRRRSPGRCTAPPAPSCRTARSSRGTGPATAGAAWRWRLDRMPWQSHGASDPATAKPTKVRQGHGQPLSRRSALRCAPSPALDKAFLEPVDQVQGCLGGQLVGVDPGQQPLGRRRPGGTGGLGLAAAWPRTAAGRRPAGWVPSAPRPPPAACSTASARRSTAVRQPGQPRHVDAVGAVGRAGARPRAGTRPRRATP